MQPIKRIDPPLPPAVRLEDPAFEDCLKGAEPMLCLSKPEAKKLLRNQIAIGRWMSGMRNVVTYYRTAPKETTVP